MSISVAKGSGLGSYISSWHTAEDPALGAPVEYIDLRGTSYDSPAVCKYTGRGPVCDVAQICCTICVSFIVGSGVEKMRAVLQSSKQLSGYCPCHLKLCPHPFCRETDMRSGFPIANVPPTKTLTQMAPMQEISTTAMIGDHPLRQGTPLKPITEASSQAALQGHLLANCIMSRHVLF